jgi:ADP-ribosylglycohydrolase/protein-tyrosine phosphatase
VTGDEEQQLIINEVRVGPGRIGLTKCPGTSIRGSGAARDRHDVTSDLQVIRQWGADAILTLVEEEELQRLQVPDLGDAIRRAGLTWYHFPLPDFGVPDLESMKRWVQISAQFHQLLDRGERLLIHCRGGLGRSGMIAALLLIERGESCQRAVEIVRRARPGAIETPAQESFLKAAAGPDDKLSKLTRASLFGGAIGDALGAEIEFWPLDRIRKRFPDRVDEMLAHDGRIGSITDDTQMTLFTAEGLLRARTRGITKGICHPPGVVHHALMRWFTTQGETGVREMDRTGLVLDPRLHVRRAPGNTCLDALGHCQRFGDPATNDSKGCGTIMRVAPVALLTHYAGERERLAAETSALTHGHGTAQAAASAWVAILSLVLNGSSVRNAATDVLDRYSGETALALRAALSAPEDGTPETVETLGGGWTAEEALSIALYSCLVARSFQDGLKIAVTHSGDSDSTGAIAGNLLGLMFPDEVMSHPWRREIECADLINRLSKDLAVTNPSEDDHDRYPGW